MPLRKGELLDGRYTIGDTLGEGGMGTVYCATDQFGSLVAVKENRSTDDFSRDQFDREAKTLRALGGHPNLPRVLDYNPRLGFFVMEYISGQDLGRILVRDGWLPESRALAWIDPALDAVEYLHEQHIIHRDVKPSNIKITEEGKVYLVDFGLAKRYDLLTPATVVAASAGFAPPEQYRGQADARSDIYSLAATLYAMLTATALPDAQLLECGAKRLIPPREIRADISPHVERAILRALEIDSDCRFPSVSDLRAALRAPLGEPAAPPPRSPHLDEETTRPHKTSSAAIELPPYEPVPGLQISRPSQLLDICADCWEDLAKHLAEGHIGRWMRSGVDLYRGKHMHGRADRLDALASRAEEIGSRVRSGDRVDRSAGLQELMEALGAPPPHWSADVSEILLPDAGQGEPGEPYHLSLPGSREGYLCGTIEVAGAPWITASPGRFAVPPGRPCAVTLTPDLRSLPPGPFSAQGALTIRTNGGTVSLTLRGTILAPRLVLERYVLSMGDAYQGQATRTQLKVINAGHGVLAGTVAGALAQPAIKGESFRVPGGEGHPVGVEISTQGLPLGDLSLPRAVLVTSNGGEALLDVRVHVRGPALVVEPASVDWTMSLGEAGSAAVTACTLTPAGESPLAVRIEHTAPWVELFQDQVICAPGVPLRVPLAARPSPQLTPGLYHDTIRFLSSAGTAEVRVTLQVRAPSDGGPDMLLVPAGEFMMGSLDLDQDAWDNERPPHSVSLAAYWIGRHPVTVAQYALFLQARKWPAPASWPNGRPPEGMQDHPVSGVCWKDALAYCRWLADATGRPYRLPTEAEWEKAARGTDGRIFPWGPEWDPARCHSAESGVRGTRPVGGLPGGNSPYGCTDMAGNVWEWTSDFMGAYGSEEPCHNPLGPPAGDTHVLRGGSWRDRRLAMRAAKRNCAAPEDCRDNYGFRCCLSEPDLSLEPPASP